MGFKSFGVAGKTETLVPPTPTPPLSPRMPAAKARLSVSCCLCAEAPGSGINEIIGVFPSRTGRFLMVFRGDRLETGNFLRRPCHGDPPGTDFSRFLGVFVRFTDSPGPCLSGGGS